jgi:hypothetical protein
MGTRLVLPDGEWLASDLELDEVERLLREGRVVAADRNGKRIAVNPAHIVYAEEWQRGTAASGGAG